MVAAVGAGLHRAGDGPLAPPPLTEPGTWGAWLAGSDPVVAAMALLRLLALVGLWYLVVATALGIVLRVARAHTLVVVADRLTVGPVRRLLVAAVGVSFASGLSPALAMARTAPAPVAVVYQLPGNGATTTTTATSTSAATTTATTTAGAPSPTLTMRLLPPPAADPPAAAPAAASDGPTPSTSPPAFTGRVPGTWTVQPGECFWSIAEDVLAKAWGRSPSDAELIPYWRTLIEQNRSLLGDRSNPDLIFPAQQFTIPTPPPPA